MKSFVLLSFLIFSLTGMPSCNSRKHKQVTFADPKILAMLSDSINIIDSLVNVIKTSDNRRAHMFANRALTMALTINSQEALARAFLLKGVVYKNFADDSSLSCYLRAYNIVNQFHLEQLKPKVFYNMAMIYYAASDPKTAFTYLDSAILLSNNMKNYIWESNAYNAMGNLKFDLLDSANSRIMCDSAYSIAKRHFLKRQMGIAMASLSRFEKDTANLTAMRKRAIELLKIKPGNEEEIALILINLGMQNSNADIAIRYYQSAIKLAKLSGSSEAEIGAYNNLAYSFLEKKDFTNAEMCLEKYAIPFAEKDKNYDWLSTLYDSYCDILSAQNKTAQALSYEQKALKYRTLADKKQAAGQVRLLAALLDLRNKELKLQTKEKELETKDIKISRLTFWLILFSIIFLIVLFAILGVFQMNQLKHHRELQLSAKRLIDSEETMKGRIARDLHDMIGPLNATIKVLTGKVQTQNDNYKVEIINRVAAITESLRHISQKMSTTFLDQLTFNEYVTGLCDDFQISSGIPIKCVIPQDELLFSGDVAIHITRIIQELLTNAVKYVTKGNVDLNLSLDFNTFFMRYKDTGPGFNRENENNKGMGIINIFERVKILNGKADLTTSPGNGTKWFITIPLNKDK